MAAPEVENPDNPPSFPLLAQDVHRVGVVDSGKRCYSELVVGEAPVSCRLHRLRNYGILSK